MQSLGEKIKAFRKRANMSQLDLEIAINASAGSISRIESGKVNPTKETLKDLCLALNITQKEQSDLFEISSLHPTAQEIESALKESSKPFNTPGYMGYLLDDWGTLYAISPALMQMLEVDESLIEQATGKSLLDVLFDPTMGVRRKLDPEKLVENYAVELARARRELKTEFYGDYYQQIRERIKSTPNFDDIEKRSLQINEEQLSSSTRFSYLILDGRKLKIRHAREKLPQNPRFMVVQLFAPEPY